MTQLLQKAVDAAALLTAAEQDTIAQVVLEEIESEQQWDELFTRSHDMLERMADEALAEHAAGLTTELDPDQI